MEDYKAGKTDLLARMVRECSGTIPAEVRQVLADLVEASPRTKLRVGINERAMIDMKAGDYLGALLYGGFTRKELQPYARHAIRSIEVRCKVANGTAQQLWKAALKSGKPRRLDYWQAQARLRSQIEDVQRAIAEQEDEGARAGVYRMGKRVDGNLISGQITVR